jgi:phosphoribosylformylglycinamidine synthase
MARFSPVMRSVREFADDGGVVVGICNGFQILCEAGLLPGALVRNRSLTFVCEIARIRVESADTAFTRRCRKAELLEIPIKHGEGCYFADEATLAEMNRRGQVLFRYANAAGEVDVASNPNGALDSIAGVMNAGGNVFGMMPHPEHDVEAMTGGEDGRKLFRSLIDHLQQTTSANPPRAGAAEGRP